MVTQVLGSSEEADARKRNLDQIGGSSDREMNLRLLYLC
jgi:hypothetical protein